MNKRIICFVLGAMLLAFSIPLDAQQQAKVPKIGWLALAARPPSSGDVRELLGRELRALGYVEGKNIAFEYRSADFKADRLPALADELVRLKVDVLVAASANEAVAAKNVTKTIPIVFLNVSDPIAIGLVDSLARPGGNITGFTNFAEVLAAKRLELLKETIPKLARVAVLWDPSSDSSTQQWKESQLAVKALGLQLHSMEVSSADKIEGEFKEAIRAGIPALAVTQSSFINSNQKRIADLAVKSRLPAIYTREDFVANGGLMSYGSDRAEPFRRAAVFVDKILKGTRPADIPVEQPMKFEFIINLKTAKQIGLTIPPNVLVRADRVIR
jgi:putative ABC transport system substrate-binding protein